MMPLPSAPPSHQIRSARGQPINQNQPLFALLGTTYGGNGQTNFALPDLRGRVPMHVGQGHVLGERGGQESHTVATQELPTHTHSVKVVNSNANSGPTNNVLAAANALYQPAPGNTEPRAVEAGNSQVELGALSAPRSLSKRACGPCCGA